MEARVSQHYILKEPRSGIRKPNCLVQFRDVSCIYKELGYIPAEYFDINKKSPAVMLPAFQ